jgi:hypothetical protein
MALKQYELTCSDLVTGNDGHNFVIKITWYILVTSSYIQCFGYAVDPVGFGPFGRSYRHLWPYRGIRISSLKGQCHEIFDPLQTIPPRVLIHGIKQIRSRKRNGFSLWIRDLTIFMMKKNVGPLFPNAIRIRVNWFLSMSLFAHVLLLSPNVSC